MARRKVQLEAATRERVIILCKLCGEPIRSGRVVSTREKSGFAHLECVWKDIQKRRILRDLEYISKYTGMKDLIYLEETKK